MYLAEKEPCGLHSAYGPYNLTLLQMLSYEK